MIVPFLRRFERRPAAPILDEALADERRNVIRHKAETEAVLSYLGRDYSCTVHNISTRGTTIAADDVALCMGVQVTVRCLSGPMLCGTVRWLRGGTFGVQFIQPLALDQSHDLRLQVPEGMRPRAGRARLRMPAMARFGHQARRIEVLNLSVGGLQMSSVSAAQERPRRIANRLQHADERHAHAALVIDDIDDALTRRGGSAGEGGPESVIVKAAIVRPHQPH